VQQALADLGIRVNAIGPGPLTTGTFGTLPPEQAEEICGCIPLGRNGDPEDPGLGQVA
jgi:NAD(P)-dependent dehydrogenase (short-subunit alcohol dehydrogenase family)